MKRAVSVRERIEQIPHPFCILDGEAVHRILRATSIANWAKIPSLLSEIAQARDATTQFLSAVVIVVTLSSLARDHTSAPIEAQRLRCFEGVNVCGKRRWAHQ